MECSQRRRALFVLLCLALGAAQPSGDLITFLPGLDEQPTFAQYSGYIAVNDNGPGVYIDENGVDQTRYLHYWFVESQNNPTTDPVTLWMNGGPGCSSLLGFLTEHGPFQFDSDGATLHANPYSWNIVANMLYLEQPSGVGFSYGGNYTSGDDIAANDNYHFLQGWFQEFPMFAKSDFFITGESYAGQYVPQLAFLVLQNNGAGQPYINLKGYAVGNPSGINSPEFAYGYYSFLRNHALISDQELAEISAACNPPVANCSAVTNQIWMSNLYGIDPYNILAPCVGFGPAVTPGCFTLHELERELLGTSAYGSSSASASASVLQSSSADSTSPRSQFRPTDAELGGQQFIPCGDYNSSVNYLTRSDVMEALHISPNALPWQPCSTVLNYIQYRPGTPSLYLQMVGKIRILVYSGDIDSCVPYLGTQRGVELLNLPAVGEFTRWMIQDDVTNRQQIAGYIQYYQGLTYLTVRGAGHMVPADRPQQALTFFARFLNNTL